MFMLSNASINCLEPVGPADFLDLITSQTKSVMLDPGMTVLFILTLPQLSQLMMSLVQSLLNNSSPFVFNALGRLLSISSWKYSLVSLRFGVSIIGISAG